ncbi:MAG: hypothetical protein MHM6MM_001841 [Cercozoa sp. M6MM]
MMQEDEDEEAPPPTVLDLLQRSRQQRLERAHSSQSGNVHSSRTRTRAQVRVQRDLQELTSMRTAVEGTSTLVTLPDSDNNLRIHLEVRPSRGFFAGFGLHFEIECSERYPFTAPQVRSLAKVFHPNIRLQDGVVLLPLLNEWAPTLSLNFVVYSLQLMLCDPARDEHCVGNETAAYLYQSDREQYARAVEHASRGGEFNGVVYSDLRRQTPTRRKRRINEEEAIAMDFSNLRIDTPRAKRRRKAVTRDALALENQLVTWSLPEGAFQTPSLQAQVSAPTSRGNTSPSHSARTNESAAVSLSMPAHQRRRSEGAWPQRHRNAFSSTYS